VCDAPSTTVTTNKDELLKFLKEMYMMRRVEITNDNEYKVPLACQEEISVDNLFVIFYSCGRFVGFATCTTARRLLPPALKLLFQRRTHGSRLIVVTARRC
jgi:hypothetical protein